jgi:hypothetical protein
MKQCPECNELFDDQKAFCDMDGSALVDQADSVRAALSQATPPSGNSSVWVTGMIGGMIGIIVCVLLYLVFLAPDRNALDQDGRAIETKETTPAKPSQVAVAPSNNQLPATEAPSPTETETPAEVASPSPAAPASTPPPAPAALNHGPIATGTRELPTERAIIKMKDGSTVEADAAWEDAQGIWFRRSGVVSFVDKSKVEAITEAERKPAPPETKTP